MLPFLKNQMERAAGAISTQVRKPDAPDSKESEDYAGLMACSEEIIKAVQANDSKALCDALRAAFELMEMSPHDEIEHDEE